MDSIENLKKKVLFRSEHRGTKEMDLLLGNFVKKNINLLDKAELQLLIDFLNFDDDAIYKWYVNKNEKNKIPINEITKKFRNFKLNN